MKHRLVHMNSVFIFALPSLSCDGYIDVVPRIDPESRWMVGSLEPSSQSLYETVRPFDFVWKKLLQVVG